MIQEIHSDLLANRGVHGNHCELENRCDRARKSIGRIQTIGRTIENVLAEAFH